MLKVVSYNIHKGLSSFNRQLVIHELAQALHNEAAQLIFLQEVQGLHQGLASRFDHWPLQGQADYIAEKLAHQVIYGGNAFHKQGHHGNAILSCLAINHWRNVDISLNRLEKRGILHAVLDWGEAPQPLHALCVHLNLFAHDRKRQLTRLSQEIAQRVPPEAPLIVAGDFNDWRNQADQLLVHQLSLKEAFETVKGGVAKSFPVQFPLLRLDRIYVRGLTVCRAEVGQGAPWSRLSDHAPLKAWVERA